MTRDLVIVGAGGFARETAAAVSAANAAVAGTAVPTWRVLGFLDDNEALHGTYRTGFPIIGGLAALADLPDAQVVVCVGNPSDYTSRLRIVRRLDLPEERYATVVHPTASVGAGVTLGAGSVLLAHVALTADVAVGANVAVMPHATLTHDDRVGDFATIASGVRVGGGAVVGTGAYLGSGALVREGVHIGAWSQVGMGSVVLRDVPAGQVWVGAPARHLRDVMFELPVQQGSR
jgi:sugar O-acyltransferase (sialic acid O-acetyltransferase NeuD family)